jgi:hypothetical protein
MGGSKPWVNITKRDHSLLLVFGQTALPMGTRITPQHNLILIYFATDCIPWHVHKLPRENVQQLELENFQAQTDASPV